MKPQSLLFNKINYILVGILTILYIILPDVENKFLVSVYLSMGIMFMYIFSSKNKKETNEM